MSPWVKRATARSRTGASGSTAASTSRGSPARPGRTCTGKIVEGGSTITQQLVRNLYIGRNRTLAEAEGGVPGDEARRCVVEAADPQDVHEPGVLRQPCVRRRGCGRDVLLASRQPADAPPGGVDRGPASGADLYDPFYRSLSRWRGGTRSYGAAGQPGHHTRAALGDQRLRLKPGALYSRIREPYFFSFVRDQLIASTARTPFARAGSRCTRRSSRATSGRPSSPSGTRSTTAPTPRRPSSPSIRRPAPSRR